MTALATLRIVSTYPIFSLTSDEPAHIASGMEWLDNRTYTFEPQHPPLARVMTAALPYLAGLRLQHKGGMWDEGLAILDATGNRDHTLALARMGILPFFWLATVITYIWTRRYFGNSTALLATFFFSFSPPILAHAGLATTDMALTATFGAAFYCMLVWLERPSATLSVAFGIAGGLAILSKFSALAFFPVCSLLLALAYVIVERPPLATLVPEMKTRLLPLAIAGLVAATVVWAGFRFSVQGRIPAPELFKGISDFRGHNHVGQVAYLFGQRSESGFWYFFPAGVGVKTPLALLLSCGVGILICCRRGKASAKFWMPLAFAAGIFVVGASSRINIGIRHVLPVYFSLSITAAIGAQWLWSSRSIVRRGTFIVLMLWLVAASVLSHPDYLAYFNEIAGKTPEKVLADSDLDWGQDWNRMRIRLKELGVTEVAVDPMLVGRPELLPGFPKLTSLDPDAPKPGWNAVSITLLKLRASLFHDHPRPEPWPEQITPAERVGKSLLLFYVPAAQ